MPLHLKVRPTTPKEIKPGFARDATTRSDSLENLTGWTCSKSQTAILHSASPSLQFFDAPMWALAKEPAKKMQICRHTGARPTWRGLLIAPPARGGRRLKNSCFAAVICPEPIDLEVRYCREVQQPTQVQQGAPRGICNDRPAS